MDNGKHAYLILVHTQPAQVRTLLSLLDDRSEEHSLNSSHAR